MQLPYLSALSGEHYEHNDRFLINIVHEYNVGNLYKSELSVLQGICRSAAIKRQFSR